MFFNINKPDMHNIYAIFRGTNTTQNTLYFVIKQ